MSDVFKSMYLHFKSSMDIPCRFRDHQWSSLIGGLMTSGCLTIFRYTSVVPHLGCPMIDQDSEEKMEVDEQTAKTDIKPMNEGDLKDGSDVKPSSATVAEVDFSISKRQLEIKITSIATREKRDTYKKICWYVNDSVLEQYSLKELPVPSAWEFITQPRKTPVKPKPEEPVNSGRKTPTVSITQFAKPMSPSTIQAQFAAANATAVATKQKQAEELAAKATESPQPVVTVQKEEPKSDRSMVTT